MHRNYSIPHPDGGWTKFSREFLEVHLEWKGWRVIVFNAHFKSKTNDDPGRRLAEAMKARDIIETRAKEFPFALLVLAGDINDVPKSPPLKELERDNLMLRVAKEIPSGGDWTYHYSGNFRAIDHIFLVNDGWGTFKAGTAKVHRDTNGTSWAGSDHCAVTASFSLSP
jgi:endonuclease/exonuclease/phosphatase family metal-dependent hydrolase